jgi:hypothetical protein
VLAQDIRSVAEFQLFDLTRFDGAALHDPSLAG